jgi:hypothetical protein
MRKLLLLAIGLLALAIPSATLAEVQIRMQMGFPIVLPPLVEVQPGVRVVQDYDEEIFFIGGYYWVERDGNWYRARDHRGTWRYVRPGGLPAALVHHQPGQYRRWKHDERRTWPDPQQARGHARHWKTADHREMGPGHEGRAQGQRKNGDGDRHDGSR